ncbi:MAG TPA: GrpB family protein [Candidatus Bathyarchaeia archaeon]
MAPNVRVVIVDYNPEWPRLFEEEKLRLRAALGSCAGSIEHMGSTSVPGLGAKPIIDIMVGVRDRAEADLFQRQLEPAGYLDVTPEPGETEWFYCLGRGTRELYYHVHLVVEGSRHWGRQLAFRDRLRADPGLAAEYDELKRRLADRHGEDRKGYTDAKTEFITRVLRKLDSALDEPEQ